MAWRADEDEGTLEWKCAPEDRAAGSFGKGYTEETRPYLIPAGTSLVILGLVTWRMRASPGIESSAWYLTNGREHLVQIAGDDY